MLQAQVEKRPLCAISYRKIVANAEVSLEDGNSL